jgi:hypothetical protein
MTDISDYLRLDADAVKQIEKEAHRCCKHDCAYCRLIGKTTLESFVRYVERMHSRERR